jgi:hypothetical protein
VDRGERQTVLDGNETGWNEREVDLYVHGSNYDEAFNVAEAITDAIHATHSTDVTIGAETVPVYWLEIYDDHDDQGYVVSPGQDRGSYRVDMSLEIKHGAAI